MFKGEAVNGDAVTPVKPKTPGGKGGRKRKADADAEEEAATPTKRERAKKAAPADVEVKSELKSEEDTKNEPTKVKKEAKAIE